METPAQFDLVREATTEMATKFFAALPNFIVAVAIFIIGWIVSSLVSKFVKKLLHRIGIDKFGEKLTDVDIIRRTNLDISLSKIAAKVVFFLLIMFFTVAATSALGLPEISQLITNIIEFIPNLLVALIILILGTILADALKSVVHTTLVSLGIGSANLISMAIFYFLFVNIVISALSQAKIDTNFLSQNLSIVIAGVVLAFSIGYGLASKEMMSNIISSFYSKNMFKIGDHITLDDVTGKIEEITKTNITVNTGDSRVVFPLNKAVSQKIKFHN